MDAETKKGIENIIKLGNLDDLAFYTWNCCHEGDGDGIAITRYALGRVKEGLSSWIN